MVTVVRVSESPVCIVTELDRAMENPNVPDELADQNEMSVSVSGDVPAQADHAGAVPFVTTEPDDADAQVAAGRVVTDDTFAVPADPGAPVCSCTLFAFVPTMLSSAAFATVVDRPSATGHRLYLLGRAEDPAARLAARRARVPGPGRGEARGTAIRFRGPVFQRGFSPRRHAQPGHDATSLSRITEITTVLDVSDIA
jgi:hypothetical protein